MVVLEIVYQPLERVDPQHRPAKQFLILFGFSAPLVEIKPIKSSVWWARMIIHKHMNETRKQVRSIPSHDQGRYRQPATLCNRPTKVRCGRKHEQHKSKSPFHVNCHIEFAAEYKALTIVFRHIFNAAATATMTLIRQKWGLPNVVLRRISVPDLLSQHSNELLAPDDRMKKLAIISTYNENCGNASYTHVLMKAFSKYVEVDIIPLDLFLLQNQSKSLVSAGDRHIKQIAAKLADYDYVNIQFEGGLYGARIADVYRRICWLIDAAPNVTLTMHRVDFDQAPLSLALRTGIAARSYHRFKVMRGGNKFASLSKNVVRHCNRASKRKNVWIKVHTRRERRSVSEIYSNPKVYDYPLAFLTPAEQADAWSHDNRATFLKKHGFAPSDKVIGLFGYLSNYKGIETAIEALAHLPGEYKLGLFGSQHPQTVKRGEPINPYLQSLFDLMNDLDDQWYKKNQRNASLTNISKKRASEADYEVTNTGQPISISERIRFVGSLPDPDFIEALRLCDATVLPYAEVGQSMSGVAVLGIEAGAKMICANNHSFFETRRYYPDTFLGFDMGNAYELAQKITRCTNNPQEAERREPRMLALAEYNIDSSVRVQLDKFGFDWGNL